jgi:hypothetical protein
VSPPPTDDWVVEYRRTHPGYTLRVDPMRCPWPRCKHRAATISERNRHALVECPGRRPAPNGEHTCAFCGRAFTLPGPLANHERAHSDGAQAG